MSMLAEPKKKIKWGLNPRGNLWANDESKFGQQLLEKMGWQKGKGLGKNEHGRVDNIVVVSKDDNKGVGWDDKANNWVAHQDDFNNLLAQLNKNYTDQSHSSNVEPSGDAGQKKPVSLEVRSKTFKSRLHYKKFVAGKDTSQYSVEDLGCIFGKKSTNVDGTNVSDRDEGDEENASPVHEAESPLKADSPNFGGVSTYTSSTSLADYFAEKMKRKTLDRRDEVGTISVASSKVDIITEPSVSQKAKKKSKKRKLAEAEGQIELNGQEEFSEKSQFTYQTSEYLDSDPCYKTKPKRFEHGDEDRRDEVGTISVDSSKVDIITEPSASQKAKKKSKKRKLAEAEGQIELNGQEEFSEKSQFTYQTSEYLDSDPCYKTKPKLFEHGDKGLEQQTAEHNTESNCLPDELNTARFSEKTSKKKKRKKQKTKSPDASSTEIVSPGCKVQCGTYVGESAVASANGTHCSSSKLDVAVTETIDPEDHATGKQSKSNSSFQSSNNSHKERPENLLRQETTNSSQTIAVTVNNCQSKKTLQNSVSKDASKHRAEQTSDLAKLWGYNISTQKNLDRSPVTYNSTNTESWASILKSARKQAPYKELESKFQKHKILSTTNLLYMSGYGISLFE